MIIKITRRFARQYEKADKKIRKVFEQRLELFRSNPYHSLLNNHMLVGRYSGYRSINITGDWRALYKEIKDNSETIVLFEVFGTHSQLYR